MPICCYCLCTFPIQVGIYEWLCFHVNVTLKTSHSWGGPYHHCILCFQKIVLLRRQREITLAKRPRSGQTELQERINVIEATERTRSTNVT